MTVLIVLLGLVISHFVPAVGRWRDFDWLLWPARQVREKWRVPAWLFMLMLVLTALLAAWLATAIAVGLLGLAGWLALALVVFVYTLGPRDLDRDIEAAGGEPGEEREHARAGLELDADGDAETATAAVLAQSRQRWFGVVLWFVLLGIPGALIYRLCLHARAADDLSDDEHEWLRRLNWVLDWPVLALMLLAAGLVADLDRVYHAWKDYLRQRPWWDLDVGVLVAIAGALADREETDGDEGLRLGRHLAWRMLILWLVVLSLLLLGGLVT